MSNNIIVKLCTPIFCAFPGACPRIAAVIYSVLWNHFFRGDNAMIALIAACARNRCIGKDGRIPWRIPGEQRRFRQLTMGAAVALGRRSF